MNLASFKLMIENDTKPITEASVDSILSKNAQLYSKYLNLLLAESKKYRQLKSRNRLIYLNLKEYFRGLKDASDPLVLERGPFNKRILEKEVEMYIEADLDYIKPQEELEELKSIIDAIRDILDLLKFRPNSVKTFVDWQRFKHGA